MEKLAINKILKLNSLQNEYEYEKASSIYLQLRIESQKTGVNYQKERGHLKKLIKEYENRNWSIEEDINDIQIQESDYAEYLIRKENEFNHKRKNLIKNKLKELDLNQNDLAKILGHRKSYMSELINGLRPFSKDDIIILNQLLDIKLEDLMSPFVKQSKAIKVKNVLRTISKEKIPLKKMQLFQIH